MDELKISDVICRAARLGSDTAVLINKGDIAGVREARDEFEELLALCINHIPFEKHYQAAVRAYTAAYVKALN